MNEKTFDPWATILVEFDQKGLAKVSRTPEEMAEKSARNSENLKAEKSETHAEFIKLIMYDN